MLLLGVRPDILSSLVLLTLFLALCWEYRSVVVRSSVDGLYYSVRAQDGAEEAADLIATMKGKASVFLAHAESDKTISKGITKRLRERLENTVFRESPRWANGTSYTLAKGEEIGLCVRLPESEKSGSKRFYTENEIFVVMLHELAHVATDGDGHGEDFWDLLHSFLRVAKKLRLVPTTQELSPPGYERCGH